MLCATGEEGVEEARGISGGGGMKEQGGEREDVKEESAWMPLHGVLWSDLQEDGWGEGTLSPAVYQAMMTSP